MQATNVTKTIMETKCFTGISYYVYIPYRPMYIDSTNETEPSGELPVAKLLQTNIEPLLKVRPCELHHDVFAQ